MVKRLVLYAATAGVVTTACMPGPPATVSPAEIPDLESRLADEPNNADLRLRYAAALYAADRCDTAVAVANRGLVMKPQDALGPLVVGQCLERESRWDEALLVYRRFLHDHPDRRGAGAIRARERNALREQAAQQARTALQEEEGLGEVQPDARTLAVLPLVISGDSAYQPLSRGLAQIITSDLGLLQAFRMVERLNVNALMKEMQLLESGAVDVSTAARVGRLLRAGRMVQGLAAIPDEGDVRLEATVVMSDGEVLAPAVGTGRLRDLLVIEKDVVIGIAQLLGYQLSQAERQLILENGTQDMAAFLAYSHGLAAEEAGDLATAALHFRRAVQRDPGFRQAAEEFEIAVVSEEIQEAQPSDVVAVASQPVTQPSEAVAETGVVADAVNSAVLDVAATQTEQVAAVTEQEQTAGTATGDGQTENPPPPVLPLTATITGTLRIYIRLP